MADIRCDSRFIIINGGLSHLIIKFEESLHWSGNVRVKTIGPNVYLLTWQPVRVQLCKWTVRIEINNNNLANKFITQTIMEFIFVSDDDNIVSPDISGFK